MRDEAVDHAFIVPKDEQEEIAKIVSLRPDVYYFGSATHDSPWNRRLQEILRKNLIGIEFKIISAYDRERLNSTRIRKGMQAK